MRYIYALFDWYNYGIYIKSQDSEFWDVVYRLDCKVNSLLRKYKRRD